MKHLRRLPDTDTSRGFTLLEIMVALAVLAIALAAVVTEASQDVKNLSRIRDHTLAHWVAMNRIAELQLQPEWPAIGKSSGTEEMDQTLWQWETVVNSTDDDNVRRLDISVMNEDKEDDVLSHLIAYLGRPR